MSNKRKIHGHASDTISEKWYPQLEVAPPATPEPQRYRIMGDNSGHKYFIKVESESEFEQWVASTEEFYADLDYTGPDFEENRIDGRFTFTDPRNE